MNNARLLFRQVAFVIVLLSNINAAQAQNSQPDVRNAVVFVVDDLGWADIGCYGSSFYETPNVDRLATNGVKFTSAYATCPVCSPTRASLITGKWPQRTGITDYIGAQGGADWKRNTQLLPSEYRQELDHSFDTIAETLKTHGLATFFAGKWHLGGEPYWPEHQGFDFNLGGYDKGGPYGGNKYFSPYGNPRLPDGPEGEHLPDRLASETVKFIQSCKEKNQPFLAYFSFYSVHTPLMARKDLEEKYKAKRQSLDPNRVRFGEEPPRKVRLVQDHAVYAGMVEAMDQAVGKVLDALESQGLDDETLVIFTSDNGGLSTSEGSPTSNLPLRAGKGWLYEGGIRVPLIVRYPGKLAGGKTTDVPACSVDLAPTLMEISKVDVQKLKYDGVSLAKLATDAGGNYKERPLFWHYPHYGNQGGAPGSAIRMGDWKLIRRYEDNREEVFNLAKDPSEENPSQELPEKVEFMRKKLDAWLVDVNASMPTANPSYDATKPSGRAAKQPEVNRP